MAARNPKNNLIDQITIERYKYILGEIRSLNENFHRFLAIFQTLTTTIIGGGVAFMATWENLSISPEIAISILRSLEGLLILLTLFIVLSIIAGMASWYDYRVEEADLLNKIKRGLRNYPKVRNFWRWGETYLLLFLIVFIALVSIYLETQIIPTIK
jgi:hypothetical protein